MNKDEETKKRINKILDELIEMNDSFFCITKGDNKMSYDDNFFEKFEKLPTYDYDESVEEDVCEFLDEALENKDFINEMKEHYKKNYKDRDELKYAIIDYVNDNLYDDENRSGSYWCDRFKAQCCLFGNEQALSEALENLGYENINNPNEAETLDLIIRMSKVNEKVHSVMDKSDYLDKTIKAIDKELKAEKNTKKEQKEQDKGLER